MNDRWWCCSADYGEHDNECKNGYIRKQDIMLDVLSMCQDSLVAEYLRRNPGVCPSRIVICHQPDCKGCQRIWLDIKDDINHLYEELIMGVSTKFPGESRHETALRYIRERETRVEKVGQVIKLKDEGE